jgi:hypothetical protein
VAPNRLGKFINYIPFFHNLQNKITVMPLELNSRIVIFFCLLSIETNGNLFPAELAFILELQQSVQILMLAGMGGEGI